MATNFIDMASRLESILQCAICLEFYKEPRILTCGHVFCEICIRRLPRTNGRSIKCPTCQKSCNVAQLPKVFILKDVIEAQRIMAETTTTIVTPPAPRHSCEMCDQTETIDNLWSCHGCSIKMACSKCMVIKHHGKCEQSPRTICDLLQEKQTYLDEWRRTIRDIQMIDLSTSCADFSTRVENMRQRVTDLRGLLRGDLIARNGDLILDRYRNELAALQNQSNQLVQLSADDRNLGDRLGNYDQELKRLEERMHKMGQGLKIYLDKYEQCSQAFDHFTLTIREILVDGTAQTDHPASPVTIAPPAIDINQTAEAMIFDLGIDTSSNGNTLTNSAQMPLNDSLQLIMLDEINDQ